MQDATGNQRVDFDWRSHCTEVSTDSIGANTGEQAGGGDHFQQWDFAPQPYTHSVKPCLRQFRPVTIFRLRQLYSVVI